MKSIIEKIAYSTEDPIKGLVELVNSIRPSNPNNASSAIQQLITLTTILREDEKLKIDFSAKLIDIIGKSEQTELFTQVNIISFKGLWPELRKRLFNKLLPYVADKNTLRGIINIVFRKKTDHIWIEQIPEKIMFDFFQTLKITTPSDLPQEHYIINELTNDIYILSQVIVSLSIDKNIVKNFKDVLQMDSPFMKLHELVDEYVTGIEKKEILLDKTNESYQKVIAQIQCSIDMVHKIRESKSVYGTSLELTSVLQKLLSSLKRMADLLDLLVLKDKEKFNNSLYQFIKSLIKLENKKYSIRSFFNDNISLLAYQMTEHTGKIGEHYVTNNAKEYFEMFIHAVKGGLVVGFLVITKFLIHGLHLPLFHDTMLKALNYSFGFIGIQLFHGTLATKQPSMTASTIAHAIESKKEDEEVKEISEFIIKVVRSQFIAVIGNIAMVLPVAFAISWIWFMITGTSIADMQQAEHKIHELNPFQSLCLVHAAIAGLMLYISGALAGIAENANIYNNYPERIKNHPILLKVLGQNRTEKLGNYVLNNIGGLTGNFTLGFFLAFVAFFGSILGLPLDIQHVTFAAGNLGMSLASLGIDVNSSDLLMACLGIVLIGLVNIAVSFSLALAVAIKSRGIKLTKTGAVLHYLLKKIVKQPFVFFFPTREK